MPDEFSSPSVPSELEEPPLSTELEEDQSAAPETDADLVAADPAVLADSLGDYLGAQWRRVKSGESGAANRRRSDRHHHLLLWIPEMVSLRSPEFGPFFQKWSADLLDVPGFRRSMSQLVFGGF